MLTPASIHPYILRTEARRGWGRPGPSNPDTLQPGRATGLPNANEHPLSQAFSLVPAA